MNSLPQHTEELVASLEGRIAIVGNATPRWKLGALIDRYEVVVRMNNFRVDGYTHLVGSRTTHRCTTGWKDVEHRREHPEFSPFTAQAPESGNLTDYNQANHHPLLTARTDIHESIPELDRPSTGLALVQHFVQLGRQVDLFAFDGFKTPHYWEPQRGIYTSHSLSEMDVLLNRPGVILYNETQPAETIPVFRRADDRELYDETVRRLMEWLEHGPRSMRILAYGVGDSILTDRLEKLGHQVTAVTPHQAAYDQLTCALKVLGSPLALALIDEQFDLFIAPHSLEHLNKNDQRLLLREAARRCSSAFVATRAPTTRMAQNWLGLLQWSGFDAQALPTRLIGHDVHVASGRLATPPVLVCANTATGQPTVALESAQESQRLSAELVNLKDENKGLREQIADLNEEWQTLLDSVKKNRRKDQTTPLPNVQSIPAKQSDLDPAEAKALQALTIHPDGVEAHRLLAGICLREDRWVEAANAARRVIELKPDDLDALSILAKCFYKTGDIESTRVTLERVLSIDPGNSIARDNLKDLGVCQPSKEDQAHCLEQLIQTGQKLIEQGDVPGALHHLEQAVERSPQDADLMVAVAGLHLTVENIGMARKHLSHALLVTPKHPETAALLLELTLGEPVATAVSTGPSPTVDQVLQMNAATNADEQQTSRPPSHDNRNAVAPDCKGNAHAFAHLQRGFDLLKERKFAAAQVECRRYRELIDYNALDLTDSRTELNPKVSIVIVAYKINDGLIQCLDSIAVSKNPSHEIIVVDNGGNESIHAELAKRDLLHVRVGFNAILAEGRNIGVHFARSNYAVFIDDDAIAAPGYVASAIEGFESFDVHAIRGKVLPKSDHPHNRRARHYNLGDLPFPADIDTEGNSAFRVDTWRKLGGQDPLLFGGEGVELSHRIAREHGDFALMYWPFMVIQHDYAVTDNKLETKSSRHALMREYSVFKHPDLHTFHNRLVAFARGPETKAEGNRLLPRLEKTGTPPGSAISAPATSEQFFSICVPTYNRAAFIEQTIASALKQTHRNFELIVVDDGSTDHTAQVVRRIADPRVRCIVKEHSGGPETRNRCIDEARGEFIVWLDSDDVLMPGTLELYANTLANHPNVDVLYGHLLVADEHLKVNDRWVYRDYHGWDAALLGDTVVENRIPNVCTLVRKSCYAKVGGYNPEFPRAHDYEFWTRLTPVAKFKSVNADVGIYRRHENSLSKVARRIDTSFEAKAVKTMIGRHPLRSLFPCCYAAGSPDKHGDARAWLIAALTMVRYGDLSSALEFARCSSDCANLDSNSRLTGILRVAVGRAKTISDSFAADDFAKRLEQAAKLFATGQTQPCARACAQLTELRPDAAETLLLVGLSLQRWANSNEARTAFRCLLLRQCERAHLEAITESESSRIDTPAGSHSLNNILAPIFREPSIPEPAISVALSFIAETAVAKDIHFHLAQHREGQTPLFYAILGLTPEELNGRIGQNDINHITRIRTALSSGAGNLSAARSEADRQQVAVRPSGYSFCIITAGKRRAKLENQIASIHALKLPAYEILVGGEVSNLPKGVRKFDLANAARAGRLGRMRNELARHAQYDHLVVADDDLIFDASFGDGLKRFGEGYDAMAVRIVNPDASRFWDWATTGGTKGSVLLDYWDADPDTYITGGICVLKTHVLDRVQWDDSRGFYEREDVDFSSRLKAAGGAIRFNVFSTVVHDDDRYSRVGRRIYHFDHLLDAIRLAHQSREHDEVRRLFPHAIRIAGNHADRRQAIQTLAAQTGVNDLLSPDASGPRNGSTPATPVSAAIGVKAKAKLEINWHGSFLDYGSLSNINRVLTDTLVIQNGASIRRIQTAPVTGKLAKPLQSYRGKLASNVNANAALTVRHAWPPDWSRPAQGKLAVIQPWEFGSLPQDWVKASVNVDAFWVPSNHVRRAYIESGVPAEKVHVVPNGIDPKVFHPQVKPLSLATKKNFKFLFVGGTIHRKGPDVLLKAYCETFTAKDDVCLVIKDFGGGSVYAGQTIEHQIRTIQMQPGAPEILYLNKDLPARDLPGLYTACDCLVHPYRGEGFGLPVLEAMACGLPVIVTADGSTDDFVSAETGYQIPSVRQVFGREISGMPLVSDGWLLEPDVDALKKLICHVVDHRDEARARGKAGGVHARENWTWNHTATRIAELAQQWQCAAGSLPAEENPKTVPTKSTKPIAIKLPSVAKLGHLGAARGLLNQHKLVPAWNATLEAIAQRPFHPEAYLLLAEIACQSGDGARTKECVDRALALAPNWKPARKFAKTHKMRPAKTKVEFTVPPSTDQQRLSVCLITKNEEKFLDQCLRSIQDIAHQIVVMDTGSTDRTIDIAKQHGAEVHSFTWCEDFSAARNAALENATGDWVLVLDADEELAPESKAALLKAMQTPNAIGWRLPIIDVGREAEGRTFVARLFRNAPGLFYVSRVHEQVFSSVEVRREEWSMETGVADVCLIHHGYTAEVVKDRNKIARNLHLLEMAVEEIPDDPNLLMNHGLELIRSECFDEGLKRYAEAFTALDTKPANEVTPELRESLLTQYTSHLMKVNRWSDIIAALNSRVARVGKLTASLQFNLGLAHQELRQWTEAAGAFRACVAGRGEPSFYLVNQVILGGAPQHCLALALWQSGDIEDAAREFAAGLKEDPTLAPLRMDAARFAAQHGDPVEALNLFHGLVTENAQFVDAWVHGARLSLSQPDFIEFARDWTAEAIKHHPAHRELIAARGETLLLTQQYADALPFWVQLNGHPRALSARLFCELMQGEFTIDGPPDNETETSQEFLNWYRRLVNFRAAEGVQAVGERLEHLAAVLPSAARALNRVLEQAAVEVG